MLIQHILTEEVFAAVFPGTRSTRTTTSPASCTSSSDLFHRRYQFQTLKGMEPYYAAIR